MDIRKIQDGETLTVIPDGRVDTVTAVDLESALAELPGVRRLILDLERVPYVSSAGLRTILIAQKQMSHQGSMKVIHVAPEVLDIFEMTGFSALLTIE